jgi:glycosyltransferase involved in cell wall biosynthesis
MTTKNILFLHKCFILGGGVERVHQNLASALREKDHHPFFYVHDSAGESVEGFTLLESKFTVGSPSTTSSTVKKIHYLLNYISTNEIDVIIAATETANLLALICAFLRPHITVIFTRHCAFDVSDQKLPPWVIKCLYSLYVLKGLGVAVSGNLKQTIKNSVVWRKERIHFIPNSVVSQHIFEMAVHNSDARPAKDYFCAVGRLVEQKGFDLLLEAYAKAKLQQADLPHLVIVGSGDDLQALQCQSETLNIGQYVEFSGFTNNPYYIIKHAQAFVLSSRHEGMPTVLVEAMALNTPVIAFDCPTGPAELIVNRHNGLLVDNQNIEQLTLAILNYKSLLGKCISESVESFKYGNVAKNYMEHF